jgi:hypothetical protein
MMPVIRVDDDVWEWLKRHARPLEDTPNSVLRRIAGLDGDQSTGNSGQIVSNPRPVHRPNGRRVRGGSRIVTGYGRDLAKQWGLDVQHALYHKDGTFYQHLKYFPGGLLDTQGYLFFKREGDYKSNTALKHYKTRLHVPHGISAVPGYTRVNLV